MQIVLNGKRNENKKALLRTFRDLPKDLSPYIVEFPADDKYKNLFKTIKIIDLETPQSTF